MTEHEPKIEYPDERLKALAEDARVWTDAFLDQLEAEGIRDEETQVERVAKAMTSTRYNEVALYEAVYLATIKKLDQQVATGKLIKIDDGLYLTPDGSVTAAALAGYVHSIRGSR